MSWLLTAAREEGRGQGVPEEEAGSGLGEDAHTLTQRGQCMDWKKCCLNAGRLKTTVGSGFGLNRDQRPSSHRVALDPFHKDSQFLSWRLVRGNKSSDNVLAMRRPGLSYFHV